MHAPAPPAPGGDGLRIVLANDVASVETARQAVASLVEPANLDARVVNRVEVVVEEVVSNIVRHGFAPGSTQRIEFAARLTDAAVVLDFADDGVAFDPLAAARPPSFVSLADARDGGLGIALVRRLAHAVTYSGARTGDARFPVNRLTVEIARDAAPLNTRRR